MPRRRSQSTGRAVAVGLVTVVVLVGGLLLVSLLANRGTLRTQLGDEEFRAGRTDVLAERIAADGPALFSGLGAGIGRDIYVQHLGHLDGDGWLALSARAPGQDDRACSLRWTGRDFQDPCTNATFPADGTGLTAFRTRLGGKQNRFLYVDLRATTTPSPEGRATG
jgi:hypothetical protein